MVFDAAECLPSGARSPAPPDLVYCTVSVTVVVCVRADVPDPEVAVTVMVLVPAGVPGTVGGALLPQPVRPRAIAPANTIATSHTLRRLR